MLQPFAQLRTLLRVAPVGFASAATVVSLASCAAPRINTTMLSTDDYLVMTDRMARELAAHPVMRERTSASEPWVFSLDRVENRTEHLMSDSERWSTMARFRALLSQSLLANERNVRFVLPPEQWSRYAGEDWRSQANPRVTPTHVLRAVFRTDTQSAMAYRTDAYLCEFQLTDLRSGEIVWSGAYQTKRAITRNSLD
jgi:hypothetical protein